MSNVLLTKNLSVGYKYPIIEDINLTIEEREIAVVIGPNGVGKSTFLKTICGLIPALSGDVMICDKRLVNIKLNERARLIATVLTEGSFTGYTCREMVSMGRYPYTNGIGSLSSEDREIIDDAMRLTGIEDLADKNILKISDGQKQRVILARAICQQPKLMVLDEPTSFLDVRYKIEFLTLLRRLSREMDFSVVMSLHELDMTRQIADKIICMKENRVDRIGSSQEIYSGGYIRDLYGMQIGDFDETTGRGIIISDKCQLGEKNGL